MKKSLAIAAALLLLSGAGWAFPVHRHHTRPPYSGPRKAAKVHSKARLHRSHAVRGKSAYPRNKGLHPRTH